MHTVCACMHMLEQTLSTVRDGMHFKPILFQALKCRHPINYCPRLAKLHHSCILIRIHALCMIICSAFHILTSIILVLQPCSQINVSNILYCMDDVNHCSIRIFYCPVLHKLYFTLLIICIFFSYLFNGRFVNAQITTYFRPCSHWLQFSYQYILINR